MINSDANKMVFYIGITSRLDWFTSAEQEALVFQASHNAEKYNADFLGTLANLTFMKSIHEGKRKPKENI